MNLKAPNNTYQHAVNKGKLRAIMSHDVARSGSRASGPGKLGAVVETGLPKRAPGFFKLSGPPGVGTPRGPEEQ